MAIRAVAANEVFVSPVHYPITLAGNFGEPRPNHFHGGIDVKTDREEGKVIHAIAEGYVSRVTVGLYGFGNAVFVQHPNGYTSVYCHLRSFSSKIAAAVRRYQYSHYSFTCDIKLKASDVPVSKGQFIAFSGNTGASFGPHLHLELHETKSWKMIDPLDYLGGHVKDTTPPEILSFRAYPQVGEGVFEGKSNVTTHGFEQTFTAWGKVGFSIRANDHMDSIYNNYGVRQTQLYVDGKCVFTAQVDGIPKEMNRMVNSWGDYDEFHRSGIWFMKSFVEPGNTLPMLTVGEDRGIINFNQERPYHVKYVLSDVFGNTTEKEFVVVGKRAPIPSRPPINKQNVLSWSKENTFSFSGTVLHIPTGLLPYDIELQPTESTSSLGYSSIYQFFPKSCPLFDKATVRLKLLQPVADVSKLYVASMVNNKINYYGGTYDDGWVIASMNDLGECYYIDYDIEPPIIQQQSLNPSSLRFHLEDKGSGLRSYEGWLDDEFILFEDFPRRQCIECNLADTPVLPTGNIRKLSLVATDNRGNKSVFVTEINY